MNKMMSVLFMFLCAPSAFAKPHGRGVRHVVNSSSEFSLDRFVKWSLDFFIDAFLLIVAIAGWLAICYGVYRLVKYILKKL